MKYNLVNENFKENYGENILKARGINDVNYFMAADGKDIAPPSLLNNIEKGAELFMSVLNSDGRVLIVVDSDCDGYTSAAIIHQYIQKTNPNTHVDYLLHEGKQHGLEDHIEKLIEDNITYNLIILPDSSSNDAKYHDQLKDIQLPCLVLDHHITDVELSDNAIVINNQLSENYENKELTGAGVTWQFCRYLDELNSTNYADSLIDLAALGIIGDMGSMLSIENRAIVNLGIHYPTENPFFMALLDKQAYSITGKVAPSNADFNAKLNPITIAFYIVPLINSMVRAGTMEEKERMYRAFVDGEVMVPSNKRGAKGTMERLCVESARECTNTKTRQNKVKETAVNRLEARIFKNDLLENKVLVVELDETDDFPPELNGLVSMQLSAKYKRPTIVARVNEEGYLRGSARGLNNSELNSFKNYLDSTGLFEYCAGHDNAFGASIKIDSLETFLQRSNEDLKDYNFGENVYDVNLVRTAVDRDIEAIVYDIDKYYKLWGQNCNEPLIFIGDINITRNDVNVIGKNNDTVKFMKNGITYIKFFAKDMIEELADLDDIKIEVIGKASVNCWMGKTSPQILIESYEIRNGEFEF